MPSCQLRSVTPAYFKTLAIRQMAGRDFSASDAAEAAPAAIVSESVVREYFPNEDPIGRQVVISINHVSGKSDLASNRLRKTTIQIPPIAANAGTTAQNSRMLLARNAGR